MTDDQKNLLVAVATNQLRRLEPGSKAEQGLSRALEKIHDEGLDRPPSSIQRTPFPEARLNDTIDAINMALGVPLSLRSETLSNVKQLVRERDDLLARVKALSRKADELNGLRGRLHRVLGERDDLQEDLIETKGIVDEKSRLLDELVEHNHTLEAALQQIQALVPDLV